MRFAICLLLFLPALLSAQINGNREVITRTLPLDGLTFLKAGLYAEVTVDLAAPAGLTITVEKNLLPYLNLTVTGGQLDLRQLEWVEATTPIIIKIGAPDLERVENWVHTTLKVTNLSGQNFRATAFLGQIELDGQLEEVSLSGESGTIDARRLSVPLVNLNLWDRGEILLGQPERIEGIIKSEGKVIYEKGNPRVSTTGGGEVVSREEASTVRNPEARFISFKLKNNSLQRIHCLVKGPKPDGGNFGYGFALNPLERRAKDWSVGSKLYQVLQQGGRKLLLEIKPEDEGKVVELFGK